MQKFYRLALAVAVAVGTAASVADEPPSSQRPLLQPPVVEIASPITDRFAVRVVYFRPSIATTVRDDNAAGTAGTTFSGEKTLGLQDSSNQGWIDLMFRMTARHRIEAQFYELKRSGAATLDQPIRFGDVTFQAGDGEIDSHMDLRQLNLTYLYSVVQREKVEVGLGIGLHLLQLTGSLESPATFKRDHLDTAGPYPTLAGDVTWRFTRRFSVNAEVHYFTYSSSGVDGNSLAWNADVQFRAQRNFAVGLGYASTRYRLDSSDPDFYQGYLKLRYQGPELFLRGSF